MLSASIRSYIQDGGIIAIVGFLWRIAYNLGRMTRAFEDHVTSSDLRFQEHEADIRELRLARRR
jgi:hypothetical protein